jgi:putative photosynthetic complex assembly protein
MGWPALIAGVLRHPIFLALAGMALVGALVAVNTDVSPGPPKKPTVDIVASVSLDFADADSGGVVVTDAASGVELRRYGMGEGTFVRGVLRTLVRERVSREIGSQQSFQLELTADGGLMLVDKVTGHWIALEAFGPDNFGEFRDMFDAAQGLGMPIDVVELR